MRTRPYRNRFSRVLSAVAVLALGALVQAGSPAQAEEEYLNNVDKNGVILDGYDPVAFFMDSKPVMGSPEYQSTYHGAIYHFASAEHKKLFDAEPAKYEPQFGAWCAYAVSVGRTAPIDVNTWSIVNGRLVVQHNARAVKLWKENIQGNLMKADRYWPAVKANRGKQIKLDE